MSVDRISVVRRIWAAACQFFVDGRCRVSLVLLVSAAERVVEASSLSKRIKLAVDALRSRIVTDSSKHILVPCKAVSFLHQLASLCSLHSIYSFLVRDLAPPTHNLTRLARSIIVCSWMLNLPSWLGQRATAPDVSEPSHNSHAPLGRPDPFYVPLQVGTDRRAVDDR